MSKYYGSKSEIDAWFIKRKPTVYDIEDEVVIANLERTMSLMKQRMEKLKASRGIFGSNGLDADANDFFSFKPPLYPGQIECDYYMKTGECISGESCNFHHPSDRSAPMPSMTNQPVQQNVQLSLACLPQTEGTVICPSYFKSGTCKYGITCKFDHPPPGEDIAMATVQGTPSSVGGEGDKGTETIQEPEQ